MKRLFVLSTLILFIISCGQKVREEITERFDDGKPKTIMKFKGEGSEEVMIEKLSYDSKGDTLFWEKPLEDFYYQKVREEIRERHSNGQKSYVEFFIGEGSSEEKIKLESYYENGQKKSEGTYKDDKKDGLWTWWYDDGTKREGTYKDGKEDGLWSYWYENGQKWEEVTYKDGKANGLWIEWYENGQKKSIDTYKDGKRDGLVTQWYENGQKYYEGEYKDGKTDVFTKWYENGQKEYERTYYNGEIVDGLYTTWYENGKKSFEGSYSRGNRSGEWTFYYENGQKKEVIEHYTTRYGRPTNRVIKKWNEDGSVKGLLE